MTDEPISDEELDEIYRRMIDLFIDQANELAETTSKENVGLAILYAASRFNAHVVSQHANTLEDYEKDLPRAREFFGGQYREMLEENLEDYKQVFTRYSHLTKKQ
jgi:ABC-type lipoprotein export system ATPase subunit